MKIVPNKESLQKKLDSFWVLASEKVRLVEKEYDTSKGSPVFTKNGKYTNRGWTDWTQGFQYGIPLQIFEATENQEMLEIGKENILNKMAHHISHFGVHDHGFTIMSTYGNLLRLATTKRFTASQGDLEHYRLALKLSGAVQAKRWSRTVDGKGYLYSFNGPHSLFVDTIRTCRVLVAAHKLGHAMHEENDTEINLLQRTIDHAMTTAKYAVFYREGRDQFDEWGRVAHESVFNTNDGRYRCPNSQQGFSGYTTWTRGLAWAMLGFTELLEYLEESNSKIDDLSYVKQVFLKASRATCDFYIEHSSLDGIPYWDTGAPNLHKLGRYQNQIANPFNAFEPVDSSAAAIGAQGLIRLGRLLKSSEPEKSRKYTAEGFKILETLLSETYLSTDIEHQGILLHTLYHYPNNWDYIPDGSKVPNSESSMWGDYHLTELCLLVDLILKDRYYTFFDGIN